jgi:hypothetical protein
MIGIVILGALVTACGGDESGKVFPGVGTTTGFDTNPPTAGGGDEAADETGTPPDNGFCDFQPNAGEDLIRHVCQAEYDVFSPPMSILPLASISSRATGRKT